MLIGLLGRKLAGDRVGLVAALIAAVYPALWVNDAMLGLETLYGFLVILALLAFYRLWQSPTIGNAALFALCLSLATLARSEGAMLFVLFALPTLLLLPRVATRRRLELFGVVVAVALVVVGPWAVRNLTTFEKPSLLGNGFGWVLLYGSCDAAFSGPHLGYWDDSCALKNYPPDTEESVLDQMARTKALDYLGDHKSRVPVVVAARDRAHLGRLPPVPERRAQRRQRTTRDTWRRGPCSSATGWSCRSPSSASWCCAAGGFPSSRTSPSRCR